MLNLPLDLPMLGLNAESSAVSAHQAVIVADPADPTLTKIEKTDGELQRLFNDRLSVDSSLTRSLVSFQANKAKAVYRWYKYKEAFSASLIESLCDRYGITGGRILDPFAGSGTSLFVASSMGLNAEGIELLPIGQQIIEAKQVLESGLSGADLHRLQYWISEHPWNKSENEAALPELRITQGAYPATTKEKIGKYLAACLQENEQLRASSRFALLCVLESVSYTRKDGQYLRWDHRSGRRQGMKPFDKGRISDFDQAMCSKLSEIIEDLNPELGQAELFTSCPQAGTIKLHRGSCLEILPVLADESYDAVLTSPPYCNRYDYTRTYALELALLGIDEKGLIGLRQQMLSCTVENRAKDLPQINPEWSKAIGVADNQALLQMILNYLEDRKRQGVLNNNGIPRMVRGYFYEMACVIAECARVMKRGALLLMVNDNVRYAGASVSVDLILSDMAQNLGFRVENILVLPNGKGNSSQQMGRHGREPLRKCVYVWRKI